MGHHTFEINEANFQQEVLESALPVLVDFGADLCPPCKMIAPFVDAIAQKYEGQLRVGMVDSDANPELVQTFGVMGLPTLLLFQAGQPVQRVMGYQPKERIEAAILPHLAEKSEA